MTRFSKITYVDGKPVETDVREVRQSDMQRCPHCIIAVEHYRPDGSCLCDDPTATVMREWGYRWDSEERGWVADGEDE